MRFIVFLWPTNQMDSQMRLRFDCGLNQRTKMCAHKIFCGKALFEIQLDYLIKCANVEGK